MVSIVISKYGENPPGDNDHPKALRYIADGPLYLAEEVVSLLKSPSSITVWTRKCRNDISLRLTMDMKDVANLLTDAVTRGTYLNSQWCTNDGNNKVWAACDSYKYARNEWCAIAHKNIKFEYYVKFAIHRDGILLLLTSCHPSED